MKILDALPVEVSPGQPIPSVGLLKSFAKPESRPSQSFGDLLHAKSRELSDSDKLTAGVALLTRRAQLSDDLSGDEQPKLSEAPESAEALGAFPDGDATDSGVAGCEEQMVSGVALEQCEIPLGLDPSDLALEAAAIAAAALLNATSIESLQTEISADDAGEIQQSIDSQVSLRFFQSSCRPSLAADSNQNQLALVSSDGGDSSLTLAAESVPQAMVIPSGAPSRRAISGSELVSVPQIAGTIEVPETLEMTLRQDLTQNGNLQLNQVVDAVVAYSRASETLVKPEPPLALQEETDSVPSVVADTPLSSVEGDAIVVEQKHGPQTSSDDQPQDAARDPNDESVAVAAQDYAKIVKPTSSKNSVPSKIVPDRPLEPTPANIAKVYSEPVVDSVAMKGGEIAQLLASDDPVRSGDVKIVGSDMSASVLPGHEKVAAETLSKPVVEGPRQVHNNVELWKAIGDAVQRVRSENPRHLAVELRMGDGSTVGLELRMGAAGVEAAFKSDSHGLLKALESQWAAFAERGASEPIKVASAVFEGRTGPDYSGGGGDAQEKREAFEDSAAAAALAWQTENFSVELPAETTTSSASPKGLLNIYA